MSIEDEIVDRVTRRMLFPVVPKAAGAPIRRAMFVAEDLWNELNSPEGDPEWDERIGKLRADLEVFVVEPSIAPKYLFLLYPSVDAVWEIRSARDDPSLRVLGLFPMPDAFVSTEYARRDLLGGWEFSSMEDNQATSVCNLAKLVFCLRSDRHRGCEASVFGSYR